MRGYVRTSMVRKILWSYQVFGDHIGDEDKLVSFINSRIRRSTFHRKELKEGARGGCWSKDLE